MRGHNITTGAEHRGGRFFHPSSLRPHPSAIHANAFEHRQLLMTALRGELRRNEPMARHVSWRAGGCVDRAYLPADLDDLRAFLATLPPEEPVHFFGLGSNLLVRDAGLTGTAVFTHWALREFALANTDQGGE